MDFGFGWVCAGVVGGFALAAACATPAAFAQARGAGAVGGPVAGPGTILGSAGFIPGGSMVRVGPGALRGDAGGRPPRQPSSLREALFGQPGVTRHAIASPPPGRYASDAGQSFVFDRQGRDVALVRFEDSPEIWALSVVPGPGGDLFFKNDVGEPVLRSTHMGGLTLFSPSRPEGDAAAQVGAAPSLRPPPSIGPQALIQALAQASARASRAAQHLIAFEAPDVTATTDWVFADAAWVVSEGFVRATSRGGAAAGGGGFVTRVVAVRFLSGRAPDVAAQGTVLRITVAPDRGPAGRPSSQRVAMRLKGR